MPPPVILRPAAAGRTSGFSLVEVLVAVLLLAILVAAASRGLMTSLASDEVSAQVFEGNLALNRLEAAEARGCGPEELKLLAGPGWQFGDARVAPAETNAHAWRILSLQSEIRPSLRIRAALRRPGPD